MGIRADATQQIQIVPGLATARVLFATAEFAPAVKVGGLGEASAGLVGCLRSLGRDVDVVMPDYGLVEFEVVAEERLRGMPAWAPPITVRRGWNTNVGDVTLLRFDGSERINPYVDPRTGQGWPDNTERFLTFSAGVATLARSRMYDVLHCNDWHSATAIGMVDDAMRTVLTVHNLAYQGDDAVEWADAVGRRSNAFVHDGRFNPLAGGLSLADQVVMVSETYADEVRLPERGCGLHERLNARSNVSGIRNGIDPGLWNPSEDGHLPWTFDHSDLAGKELCRKALLAEAGLPEGKGPVIGLVARFVHQKGIDLALELAPFLSSIPARLVLIGSGTPDIVGHARSVATAHPDHVAVFPDYDESMAHLVVAGADLLLVPSRFEPCGLTQMQAMTCGTIPVVTNVGGLRDTVVDTDAEPRSGTGFVAAEATPISLLDAVHRAARGWANPRRRAAVQRRGMTADWSWAIPAQRYLEVYSSTSAPRMSAGSADN